MSRTIVSIWPMEQTAQRSLFKPSTPYNQTNTFTLPAASKEAPRLLTIGHFKQDFHLGEMIKPIPVQINDEDIARDLVATWADYKGDGLRGRPGIWLTEIENPTVEKVKASDEYRKAVHEQDEFAQAIVMEARELFRQKHYGSITRLHFAMADYLKIQGEEWQTYKPQASGSTKNCMFCTAVVPAQAIVCPNCHQVLDQTQFDALTAKATPPPQIPGPVVAPVAPKPQQSAR